MEFARMPKVKNQTDERTPYQESIEEYIRMLDISLSTD